MVAVMSHPSLAAFSRVRPGLLAILSTIGLVSGASPAAAVDKAVGVSDNIFTPSLVAVTPGSTVTWNYSTGGDRHSVNFEDGLYAHASPTGAFPPWTAMRTFPANGEFRYFCDVHGGPGGQGMSGTVYVNATATLPGRPPRASFTATPQSALVDQNVSFDGAGSIDPDGFVGSIVRYQWDLDGDGAYEIDGVQASASRSYATSGTRLVRLRVTDIDGLVGETTRPIAVSAPLPPPPPPVVTPPAPPPGVPPPALPVVPAPVPGTPPGPLAAPALTRLGSAVSFAARARPAYTQLVALAVRPARAGSTVRVACTGRACPVRTAVRRIARNAAKLDLTSLVRGRRLRPGSRLEVRVTKPGSVGVVRRLTIRAGRGPRSESLCLAPGASRPAACTV